MQVCIACDLPRPEVADPRYEGYAVGNIAEVESIPKTNKLSAIKVDVGEEELLTIVTNAKVKQGMRIVVAKVGAKVEQDGEEIVVKKATVGGRPSEGMLCNGPMLGWTGGDANAAAQVPESFALGAQPPSSRPRLG